VTVHVVADEVAAFAEAVATAADRALSAPEPWRPGAVQDDRSPALSDALAGMGWVDLAEDPALLPLAGPAALELGRRLAPLDVLDALLGGSPLAGGLVRHGARYAVALEPAGLVAAGDALSAGTCGPADAGGVAEAPVALIYAIEAAEPVAYGDALGVHRVLASSPAGEVGAAAVATWTAASVGYLAGLADWALALALDHAKGRRAFGTTLAGLAPVQQRLADAATTTRGLALLAHDRPGRAALAHAGHAAVEVTAACHQVAGAIGFTLEFPLQRAYRRARAVQLWADALLTPPSR
jgi:hypothetical protein